MTNTELQILARVDERRRFDGQDLPRSPQRGVVTLAPCGCLTNERAEILALCDQHAFRLALGRPRLRDAVDPHAADPGTPTPRAEKSES